MAQRQASWLLGLERPTEGRVVAGVCAGLAGRLDLDVSLLRLAAVLLALASGIGVILYLAGWLMIPQQGLEVPRGSGYGYVVRSNLRGLEEQIRQTAGSLWSRRPRPGGRPSNRRWIAYILIIAGGMLFLYSLGVLSWLGPMRSIGLAVIAIGAAILATNAGWSRKGDEGTNR
jgi:phage shock protein PspC (stress-responsive transcriptional regulator)